MFLFICTVKLGNKERFDKEQIGIKELIMDYQPFYTINLLLDKELLPIQKMPKLGIKEHKIVKIGKKRGLSVLPDSELSRKQVKIKLFLWLKGLKRFFMKLSIEEKRKQTKITEMLAINKQSDENITVEIIQS